MPIKKKPEQFKRRVLVAEKGIHADFWRFNGQESRYEQIYNVELMRDPILHLESLQKEHPQIMILGPGLGEDIIALKRELTELGMSPDVDVFGLSKSLDQSARRRVRTDYSLRLALEEVDPKNEKHRKLIDNLQEKYDLVVAPKSVGYHTNYPAYAVFATARLLAKGGAGYIELKIPPTSINAITLADLKRAKEYAHYRRALASVTIVFNRMVSALNKKRNPEEQVGYRLDFFSKSLGSLWVKITRIY